MKYDWNDLPLQNAFPPEPEACHRALMQAARSVKEEPPVKKMGIRAVCIAVALILATMATAVAAGLLPGWTEFFSTFHDTDMPEAAQRILSESENEYAFTLGPVAFYPRGLLCDGHIAMASTEISMADGSDALLCLEPGDAIGANGENGQRLAQRLGVDPSTSWMEAAKKLNRKLYCVRAILEVPAEIDSGEAMEDALLGENGEMTYFSMAYLNGEAQGETVDVSLYLRVAQIDTDTGEETDVLTRREALSLYLEAPIETYRYPAPEDGDAGDGYLLTGVEAELTPAGLYMVTTFAAPDSASEDSVFEREYPAWTDAGGQPLPMGISMSESVDIDAFPTVVYTQMFSVNVIPEKLLMQVRSGTQSREWTFAR